MSLELVAKAKKTSTQGDTLAKLLLIILSDYANDDNLSWPSVKTLAEETEKSPETIKRARRKLISLGLIRVADDQSAVAKYRADRRPTVYQITIENAVSKTTPRTGDDASTNTHDGVSDTTPRQIDGVSSTTSTGCQIRRERGVADDTQTVIDNKLSKQSINPLTGVNDARETHATAAEWEPTEQETLDLIDELNADLTVELRNYRTYLKTLANKGEWPDDIERTFRNGLMRANRDGFLAKRPAHRQSDHKPPLEKHKHHANCEHVLAALADVESEYDHTSPTEFGDTSEWARARFAKAVELNRQETIA